MSFMNMYRVRRVGDTYIITSEHGRYALLDEREFKLLKELKVSKDLKSSDVLFDDKTFNNLDRQLYDKLLDAGVLINEKNIKDVALAYSRRRAFLNQGVSLHIMVLTLRCNMNCVYCHASSKARELKRYDMTKDTIRKTVDFIFQTPSKAISIEFQGGEPLLNWEGLVFAINYALEKNVSEKRDLRMQLVTNLSFMDDKKMNFLLDNKVGICTSLDGPKNVHDANRVLMGKSNYDEVVHWIKRISKEYKLRGFGEMNAIVTLTKKSLEFPKEIVDEYVNLGLRSIHLRFLNRIGVARTGWDGISYTPEQYLDFWEKAVSYIDKINIDKVSSSKSLSDDVIRERIVEVMAAKFNSDYDPNYIELRSPCGAAISQLAYDFDGKIYTCDEARMLDEDLFCLGDVERSKYSDVVTCDKACATINASMNEQFICDSCAYKPYCGVCPVLNYAEQGSIIAKIPQTDRCKIYMRQFDWVVKNRLACKSTHLRTNFKNE